MLFESPPMVSGGEAQKIAQIYSYLYQMAEKLNIALNSLGPDNFSQDTANALRSVASGTIQKAQEDQADALKSLIIKTAGVVRAEMDVLETTLQSEYVAASEFGEYKENAKADVQATAYGVIQNYDFSSILSDVEAGVADFESYRTDMQAYIKTGLLYYNDSNHPVYGVAVGQDFSKTMINGKEVLARNGVMSTFTAGRLSFWQGKTEMAYMTDGVLHIRRAELSDHLIIGNYIIKRMSDGGFAILSSRSEE